MASKGLQRTPGLQKDTLCVCNTYRSRFAHVLCITRTGLPFLDRLLYMGLRFRKAYFDGRFRFHALVSPDKYRRNLRNFCIYNYSFCCCTSFIGRQHAAGDQKAKSWLADRAIWLSCGFKGLEESMHVNSICLLRV